MLRLLPPFWKDLLQGPDRVQFMVLTQGGNTRRMVFQPAAPCGLLSLALRGHRHLGKSAQQAVIRLHALVDGCPLLVVQRV